MIATVSTVKDTLPNVQRFVSANLAGGVDHMLIFLDTPDVAVQAWLAAHAEVTVIVTDRSWWRGDRPALLNVRQNINANLTRLLLKDVGCIQWLFHLDADEVAQIDRAALARVPDHESVINLRPLEVVGVLHPDGPPTLFKRLLSEDELNLVHALGLLSEPSNSRYFRSHIAGKVGVRPEADIRLGIHKATDASGNRLRIHRDSGLEMLHFEAYSGAEFTRKWTNMVTSGPAMNFGEDRMALASALRTLVNLDVSAHVKERHLNDFYQRHMADPVDELESLGLLVRRDPSCGTHIPMQLSPAHRSALLAGLEGLREHDKRQFRPPKATRHAAPPTPPGQAGRRTGLTKRALNRLRMGR